MLRLNLILWLSSAALLWGQPPSARTPLADAQKVELEGVIERVQAVPGQGMPYLELKQAAKSYRVLLGSMRYLLEKNFNPKAGSSAIVRGFLLDGEIVAQSVELPAEKITIQLRDRNGVPLWRMGHRCCLHR